MQTQIARSTLRRLLLSIASSAAILGAATSSDAASTPYTGTPIALPGTFEAENFDRGGRNNGYSDKTPGNQGGQYRTSEDVDIISSSDSAGGGYVVNNFQTGEWLAYTVNVPTAGKYDIAIRASSAFTGTAFHVEIDGVNVTGNVVVPNTGSWSSFQWVVKPGVTLAAGRHVLKLAADQQWFNVNQLRVTAAAGDTQAPSVPTGLSATAVSPSQINLAWQPSTDNTGVAGYNIYSNGSKLATATGTTYGSTGLTAGTTYGFTVSAFDAAGKESAQSAAASATTPALQKPYSGSPVPIPGVLEAENFDLGGEGIGHHDLSPGNSGGQYRNENADIVLTSDTAGGSYDVNNFQSGEWLAYTISVPANGNYDIDLRAVTNAAFPNAAFHIEIDGVNKTGTVVLPTTDPVGWSNYQWVGKKTVALTAGTHVLKLVSQQQYFNVNQIRVAAAGTSTSSARKLFASGYEGSTVLNLPSGCYTTGCWQGLAGLDTTTGYAWPPAVWGGGGNFQQIADANVDSSTIGNYMSNQIQTVTGPNGASTRALYSVITQSGCCGTGSQGGGSAQDPYILQPGAEGGDMYIRYWLKLQPNLQTLMSSGSGWNWRVVFEWKTAGDYRVIAQIQQDPGGYNGGRPWWRVIGDNNANGGLPYQMYWDLQNTNVPVPVGQWFKVEVFWHRSSGSDGRVWLAINGQTIADQRGPNKGVNNAPINRIFLHQLYSSSGYPIYQWVDDVEIWDGFPSDASAH